MLKAGASSSDLSDLVMEYNLLKELDHPNVIKLLGACTDSRGPLYLIIEFAQHGSLRNYLRSSRESTSKTAQQSAAQFQILLSFGWQISKGMAYLEGLKVRFEIFSGSDVIFLLPGRPQGPGHQKCPAGRGDDLQGVRLWNVSRCLC